MSSKKINYNLRPSKAIERKLILEVLKSYSFRKEMSQYRYIGFGAVYFYDFKLFHNELDISDMISIEMKSAEIERCQFNKPFKCIEIKNGRSNDILPKLKWNKKSIVWLDYDGHFESEKLDDISICTDNLTEDSFIIITVRKRLEFETTDKFKDEFGDDSPYDLKLEDLEPKIHYRTIRRIILNKIETTLSERFANTDDPLLFKQLFNYTYKDGAEMYTLGGVFIKKSEEEKFGGMDILKLPYVSQDENAYDINFPKITNKEIHILNQHLPNEIDRFLSESKLEFIPKEHRENYFKIYKYFPMYIEINNL